VKGIIFKNKKISYIVLYSVKKFHGVLEHLCIRHMNALKPYEDLKDTNLVAQALDTSSEIVKSNYLNYSDE